MAVVRDFNPISLLIYSAKRFKPYLVNSYSVIEYYNHVCRCCQGEKFFVFSVGDFEYEYEINVESGKVKVSDKEYND